MFERFTDRARRVIVLAQDEARPLNHDYIGTEHILLGLVAEGEGIAATSLESFGISLKGVRSQIEETIGRGQQVPSGPMPFTPRAKKVLELSLREAQQLGRSYIGTEHILLSLIQEGDGRAVRVLARLGADLHGLREMVNTRASARAEEGAPRVAGHELTLEGTGMRCLFCGLTKARGVSGETRELFVCDDCIALMVNMRRTELGDDAWPPAD